MIVMVKKLKDKKSFIKEYMKYFTLSVDNDKEWIGELYEHLNDKDYLYRYNIKENSDLVIIDLYMHGEWIKGIYAIPKKCIDSGISAELSYIKEFSKISISSICRDLKVNRSNLLNGNTSKETELKVKTEIQKRLIDIINKYG